MTSFTDFATLTFNPSAWAVPVIRLEKIMSSVKRSPKHSRVSILDPRSSQEPSSKNQIPKKTSLSELGSWNLVLGAFPGMPHPVEITFDCLPLRSVGRLDIPIDASPKYRERCLAIKRSIGSCREQPKMRTAATAARGVSFMLAGIPPNSIIGTNSSVQRQS